MDGRRVLEEMEELRASRVEDGRIPVWLPPWAVRALAKYEGGAGPDAGDALYEACREALPQPEPMLTVTLPKSVVEYAADKGFSDADWAALQDAFDAALEGES